VDDKLLFEGSLLNFDNQGSGLLCKELDEVDDLFNQLKELNKSFDIEEVNAFQEINEIVSTFDSTVEQIPAQSSDQNDINDLDVILNENKITLNADLDETSRSVTDSFLKQLDNTNFVDANRAIVDNVVENPNPNWTLLPIPENMQSDSVFSNMQSVSVDQTIIERLNTVSSGFSGIRLSCDANHSRQQQIIVKSPLQCVQEVVKRAPNECEKENVSGKRKRKQSFDNFPQEDVAVFIEENLTPPPMKKIDLNAEVIEVESSQEPGKHSSTVCPHCNIEFKRIKLHRCKGKQMESALPPLRPSDIPMPENGKGIEVERDKRNTKKLASKKKNLRPKKRHFARNCKK
jgi:hypothetical protein